MSVLGGTRPAHGWNGQDVCRQVVDCLPGGVFFSFAL